MGSRLARVAGPLVLVAALLPWGGTAYAAPKGDGGDRVVAVDRSALVEPTKEGSASKPEPPGSQATSGTRYTYYYGPITSHAGEWHETWANCPAGTQATGGGESNTSSFGMTMRGSYALPGGSGWKVHLLNQYNADITFKVWVICASGLSSYTHTNTKAGVSAHQWGRAHAVCPNGIQVLGGGGWTDAWSTRMYTTYSGPTTQWEFTALNNDAELRTVNAQVICANSLNVWGAPGAPVTIGPGQTGSSIMYCPSGSLVIGGGGNASMGSPLRLTDSFPENEGWRVYFRNDTPDFTSQGSAYVVCGS